MANKPAAPATGATSRTPPKKIVALYYLLNRSLIELEALSLYGETCLHSTISELANRDGLRFQRKREQHHHQHRGTTYFTRYTLEPESRQAAQLMVAAYDWEAAA